MAFTACTFRYDGISCDEFGLTLCEIGNEKMDGGVINDGFAVESDYIANRIQPIHYGVKRGTHKEFELVFGADTYLSREDVASIAGWLLNRSEYAPLVIEQDDMNGIQYKAIFTTMKIIQVGGMAVGFSAHVVCDSPYAYTEPLSITYGCDGEINFHFTNLSNLPDLYAPNIRISLEAESDFKMVNETTGQTMAFEFSGANTDDLEIFINGKTKAVTLTKNPGSLILNPYRYMRLNGETHFVFPQFVRGDNKVKVTGNCAITIESEFPVAVGY